MYFTSKLIEKRASEKLAGRFIDSMAAPAAGAASGAIASMLSHWAGNDYARSISEGDPYGEFRTSPRSYLTAGLRGAVAGGLTGLGAGVLHGMSSPPPLEDTALASAISGMIPGAAAGAFSPSQTDLEKLDMEIGREWGYPKMSSLSMKISKAEAKKIVKLLPVNTVKQAAGFHQKMMSSFDTFGKGLADTWRNKSLGQFGSNIWKRLKDFGDNTWEASKLDPLAATGYGIAGLGAAKGGYDALTGNSDALLTDLLLTGTGLGVGGLRGYLSGDFRNISNQADVIAKNVANKEKETAIKQEVKKNWKNVTPERKKQLREHYTGVKTEPNAQSFGNNNVKPSNIERYIPPKPVDIDAMFRKALNL